MSNRRIWKTVILCLILCCFARLGYLLGDETKKSLDQIRKEVISILNSKGLFGVLRQQVTEEVMRILPSDRKKALEVLDGLEIVYSTSKASLPLSSVLFCVRNGLPADWLRVIPEYEFSRFEDEILPIIASLQEKSDRELMEEELFGLYGERLTALLRVMRERVEKGTGMLRLIVKELSRWKFCHFWSDDEVILLISALSGNIEAARKEIANALESTKGKFRGALYLAAACLKMDQAYGVLNHLKLPKEAEDKEYLETALDVLIVHPTEKAFPTLKKMLDEVDINKHLHWWMWIDALILATAYCKPPNKEVSFRRFLTEEAFIRKKSDGWENLLSAVVLAKDKTVLDIIEAEVRKGGWWVYYPEALILLDRERALKIGEPIRESLQTPFSTILTLYGEEEFLKQVCKDLCADRYLSGATTSIVMKVQSKYGLVEKAIPVLVETMIKNYKSRYARYNIAQLLAAIERKDARYVAVQLLFDPDPAVRAIVETIFKEWYDMDADNEEWIAHGFPISTLGKITQSDDKKTKWKKQANMYHFYYPFQWIERLVAEIKKIYEREWSHFYYMQQKMVTPPVICCKFNSKVPIDPFTRRELNEEEQKAEKERLESLKLLTKQLEELQYAEWAGMDVKKWRELTDEEKERIKEKLREER